MLVVVIAVIAVALLCGRGGPGLDLPERIVLAATHRLPPNRQSWGQALVAELAAVGGRVPRWRFAVGVLRIALFPPASKPTAVRATATVSVAATVVASVAAVRLVPTLSVFVAALGLLTSGYAIAIACRRPRVSIDRIQLAAGAMALTGVLAVIGTVIAVAVTDPAATRDRTHVFSVVLAAALCGYLVAGLSMTAMGSAGPVALGGAIAGAGVVVAATILLPTGALSVPISPIMAAATLATAIIVGVRTRSRSTAARAGLLAAILSAPIQFAVTVMAVQHGHPSALTNSYDIAAYPRSGYPDVASYLLSDALGGNIVSLVITPLVMYALATVGAAAAPRRPAL